MSELSWFILGYTSKTPGTEDGIKEPSPTFSTCFGQPFIVLHPSRYASMLAKRMTDTGAKCWLLNTGKLAQLAAIISKVDLNVPCRLDWWQVWNWTPLPAESDSRHCRCHSRWDVGQG